MIRMLAIASIATGALLLMGCASIVNGHNQSVSVKTTNKGADVSGGRCSLSNDKGVWYLSTPGSVTVHRSYGDLALTCTLAGLPDGLATVKSSTTAAAFGNILVGGVIGARIDVATGAAYSYPDLLPVEMGQTTRLESTPTARTTKSPAQPVAPAEAALVATRVPYLNLISDLPQLHE